MNRASPSRAAASNRRNRGRRVKPEAPIDPSPRQYALVGSNTVSIDARACGLPSGRTARAYWFSSTATPRSSWLTARAIPSSKSTASGPMTITGTPYFSARGANGLSPTTAADGPETRTASARRPGDESKVSTAGARRKYEVNKVRLASPSRSASSTAAAAVGAVVSKPTASPTTCRSGCFLASASTSSGE